MDIMVAFVMVMFDSKVIMLVSTFIFVDGLVHTGSLLKVGNLVWEVASLASTATVRVDWHCDFKLSWAGWSNTFSGVVWVLNLSVWADMALSIINIVKAVTVDFFVHESMVVVIVWIIDAFISGWEDWGPAFSTTIAFVAHLLVGEVDTSAVIDMVVNVDALTILSKLSWWAVLAEAISVCHLIACAISLPLIRWWSWKDA
jgi:hypothetical protein